MALLGVLAAFGLLVLLVWLFPEWFLEENPDYQRRYANLSLNVEFKISDGNMYDALPGRVRPPDEDTVLAAFTLTWDESGFRAPHRTAAEYPIAVFGDSFTEGFNVAQPWPDVLDEITNVPVRIMDIEAMAPLK